MSASVVAHWSAQLKDAPSIELSITNPTTDPNLLAGHLELELGPVDPLEAVAAAEYVSLSDVLLAAYAALLHRYSGQSDLPIGVLDNDGPGVVVRAQVEGGEPFATLVGSVYNAGAVAAFNKDYALEDLVLALGVGRTDGRHPLYQVAFAFDVEVPTGETTPYDLLLAVWTTPSTTLSERPSRATVISFTNTRLIVWSRSFTNL